MKLKKMLLKLQMILCMLTHVLTILSVLVRYVSVDWPVVSRIAAILIAILWWLQ